jgi:heterodisulfide reductase subunit B
MWLTIAARNLALAENIGYDVLVICNGCMETLTEADKILKEDGALRDRVNQSLKPFNLQYTGKIRVVSIIEVLHDKVGINKIFEAIKKPLTNITVAPQPGCRLYKNEQLALPQKFKKIAETIGCKVAEYETERVCCGAPAMYVDSNFAYMSRTRVKLDDIKKVGADCITVLCPECLNQFEMSQLKLRESGLTYDIPCINLLELVAMAMGNSSTSIGTIFRKIRPMQLLKKIEGR